MSKINRIIQQLDLQPHPEGGFYRQTYKSDIILSADALPEEFGGDRSVSTAIYFLLDADNFSALHRIKSDEMWHFYKGDALEVVVIHPQGELEIIRLGTDIETGEVPQAVVKGGRWFGSRVAEGGSFSLVGCTVTPGFDFADFEMGERGALLREFPQYKEIIEGMTRL